MIDCRWIRRVIRSYFTLQAIIEESKITLKRKKELTGVPSVVGRSSRTDEVMK